MKKFHPGHLEIANHTPEQQAKFFVSAADLGFESREVKERAKKYFKTDCFNKLTVSNLMVLIDKLEQKRMEENR